MWFKYITPNWYFIDPTQRWFDSDWNQADHDGSTIAKADKSLPDVLQDNTVYLIRRSNEKWIVDTSIASYPTSWCYTHDSTITGGSSSEYLKRVAIVGMPKSDDELYQYMPEEAKTAWGNDEYDYAILAEHPTSSLTERDSGQMIRIYSKDIAVYNIHFKRRYRRYVISDGYALNRSNNIIQMICDDAEISKFYSCVTQSNFLDESERNGSLSTGGNDYWFCPNLILIEYNNTCKIYNGIILSAPDQRNSGNGAQFRLHSRMGTAEIHNITIYEYPMNTERNTDDVYYYPYIHNATFWFSTPDSWYELTRNNISDINVYLFKSTRNYGNGYRGVINGHGYMWNIKDIQVQEAPDNMQFGTYYPRKNSSWVINVDTHSCGSVIDNVMVDLPKCSKYRTVAFNKNRSTSRDVYFTTKGQWNIVKNITFNGTPSNETPIWNAVDNDVCMYIQDNNKGLNLGDSSYVYLPCRPICDQLIAQNINVKCYHNPSNYTLSLRGVMIDMGDNDIEGSVWITNSTGKIKSIKVKTYGGALTDDIGGNLLYIGKIECFKDKNYAGQQAIEPCWRSQILVGQTNTKFLRDNTFSTDVTNNNDHMYICTSDSLEGNFVARNRPAKAETWSVYRTGGHPCTLRFVCEQGDIANNPLRIGDAPFAGIKKALTAGTNKCTFYLTTFGYSDPSMVQNKMRFRAKLPSGEFVGGSGIWEKDEETVWNNIELNESYKYTMYIDVEEDCEVEFSYQYWWYFLSAYTYLDPFPEITHID